MASLPFLPHLFGNVRVNDIIAAKWSPFSWRCHLSTLLCRGWVPACGLSLAAVPCTVECWVSSLPLNLLGPQIVSILQNRKSASTKSQSFPFSSPSSHGCTSFPVNLPLVVPHRSRLYNASLFMTNYFTNRMKLHTWLTFCSFSHLPLRPGWLLLFATGSHIALDMDTEISPRAWPRSFHCYPGVDQLDPMTVLFSVFWRTSILFP